MSAVLHAFLRGQRAARANPTPRWTIEHATGLRDDVRTWREVAEVPWQKTNEATLTRAREMLAFPDWVMRELDLVRLLDARGVTRLFGVVIRSRPSHAEIQAEHGLRVFEAPPVWTVRDTGSFMSFSGQQAWGRPFGRDWQSAWMSQRAQYLFVLALSANVPTAAVVRAAIACIRTKLWMLPPGEDRPRRAVEAVEAWLRDGEDFEAVARACGDGAQVMNACYSLLRLTQRDLEHAWALVESLTTLQSQAAASHVAFCEALRREVSLPEVLHAYARGVGAAV